MRFILQEENKYVLNERFILQETAGEIDWAAKYNGAINKEAVWEEYLNTIWESDFDRIKDISKAFEQECKSYGFDKTNPFITFIKEVYLKTKMPKSCYEAIHNAVVDHYLNDKDLLGKGKLGKLNIIFCPDLYIKEEANIAAYLKKQSLLLNKVVPKTCDTIIEFATNVLYQLNTHKKENFLRALDPTNLKLNTFSKINELEVKLSGSVSAEEKTQFKADDTFIESISTLEDATKLIICLALKFATNAKISSILTQYKETVELLNTATTSLNVFKMIEDIDTRFKLKGIKEAQSVDLVAKIINSDKFKFTKI